MFYFQECEVQGFQVDEVQIALQKCPESKMEPLMWLRDFWLSMVKLVMNHVSEGGRKADQNDIGDLSMAEAKRALIDSNGDIEKATAVCTKERRRKVHVASLSYLKFIILILIISYY